MTAQLAICGPPWAVRSEASAAASVAPSCREAFPSLAAGFGLVGSAQLNMEGAARAGESPEARPAAFFQWTPDVIATMLTTVRVASAQRAASMYLAVRLCWRPLARLRAAFA